MVQINPVWIIYILILLFACLNIWIHANRRILTRARSKQTQNFRKNCIRCNWIGSALILAGMGLFAYIWIDIQKSPGLLRPIAEMAAQPVQMLAVTFFIAGLTTLMTGISYHKVRVSSEEDG